MKNTGIVKIFFNFLLFFLLSSGWAFHIASGVHSLLNDNCQLCSVSCSPELNSDCDSNILPKPEYFIWFELENRKEFYTVKLFPLKDVRAPPFYS
jgi:hypothetical protein